MHKYIGRYVVPMDRIILIAVAVAFVGFWSLVVLFTTKAAADGTEQAELYYNRRSRQMRDVQSLLQNATLEYDKADNEVERLLDILDKVTLALQKARQSKRMAKKQLDDVIAFSLQSLQSSSAKVTRRDRSRSEYSSEEENEESKSCSSSGSEEEQEERRDELDNSTEDDDITDAALEQVRYRLRVAKIDPNSPQGSSLLEELLSRLKNTNDTICDDLVNEFMDDLLNEGSDDEEASKKHDDESRDKKKYPRQSRIKISRRGKVLGWYEGGLDDRGYARQGKGTMYYRAGHVCSGYWQDDEMVGRGIYQWADGHVYDGEWLNGKRHGLGCFIRPDGVVLFGRYEDGFQVGKGVRWSADKKEVQIVENGVPKNTIDLIAAMKIKKELGFDDSPP